MLDRKNAVNLNRTAAIECLLADVPRVKHYGQLLHELHIEGPEPAGSCKSIDRAFRHRYKPPLNCLVHPRIGLTGLCLVASLEAFSLVLHFGDTAV
jgi:hypothetical protein